MTHRPYFADWDVSPRCSPLPTLHAVKTRAHRLLAQRRAVKHNTKLHTIYTELARAAGYPSWTAYRAALVKERHVKS